MASARLVQLSLLLVLLVLEQPSFAHTHLGIQRKTGGRKMLVNQLSNQGIKGSNKMPDGSVSKISGNDAVDLTNVPFEVPKKHQMNVHQVETVELKAESTLKAHQHEGANYESKEFVDATNEVANLTWKDYSGRARPRRKPPIHNYDPTTKH
ncbi:hypothetical protein HAX54_040493 [Datura stramonium]|uniref:Uncharacterized protein n=1 Tax=Datura stramonium TaxID=4076 RepID=A0ABS8VMQ4_DATST|nr:hypothetical protein [Datura stramonium]